MSSALLAVRATTTILGLCASALSVWHAHGAWSIEAPGAVALLFGGIALVELLVSVRFVLAPGGRSDGQFLFVFGIAAVGDIARFLAVPFLTLLVAPAAFLAGTLVVVITRVAKTKNGDRS